MGLLQVVVYAAASKVDSLSNTEEAAPPAETSPGNAEISPGNEPVSDTQKDAQDLLAESNQLDQSASAVNSKSDGQRSTRIFDIFLLMPHSDLRNLCGLLGHEGYLSLLSYIYAFLLLSFGQNRGPAAICVSLFIIY